MKTTRPFLTKSDLQSLLQCLRKLWLEHHEPHLLTEDDAAFSRRTTDGNIVGEIDQSAMDTVAAALKRVEK